MTSIEQTDCVAGAILGCAVGDAMGLPYEALSKRRGIRLLGPPDRYRFVFHRGMVSDDTEHTCMVAQSLCLGPRDPERFTVEFARRLRWWLLGVPAGIGFATLRATVKLWLGYRPSCSGVFSAGNGPAMRSPILGAAIENLESLRAYVLVCTRVTHTDPKAFLGALACALAAWSARHGNDAPHEFFPCLRSLAGSDLSDEFDELMSKLEDSLKAGDSTQNFAEQLGCRNGVSGYVYRTVPVALHSWLSHPRDFRMAVTSVIQCGGDTDTTAAIVGAIVGTAVGQAGIPESWLEHLWEWPRSVAWMQRLAKSTQNAVTTGEPVLAPPHVPLVGLARNAVFLAIVFGHLLRRMLPPY